MWYAAIRIMEMDRRSGFVWDEKSISFSLIDGKRDPGLIPRK